MDEYHLLNEQIIKVTGTESKMILQYLGDASLMLSLVSVARESDINLHIEAEKELLKQIRLTVSKRTCPILKMIVQIPEIQIGLLECRTAWRTAGYMSKYFAGFGHFLINSVF